jgi:hypothetical protein
VANTDHRIIKWITDRVQIGSVHYRSKLHEGCKDVFHIGWASGDALDVLKAVLPYLTAKRDRALLALSLDQCVEWVRKMSGGYFGNHHPLPELVTEAREAAFVKMQTLNSRGISCP